MAISRQGGVQAPTAHRDHDNGQCGVAHHFGPGAGAYSRPQRDGECSHLSVNYLIPQNLKCK